MHSQMASWWVVKSSTFRVKESNKKPVEKAVDLENPLKSLEDLESKTGLKCPDDKKTELINSLGTSTVSSSVGWLENVSVPDWYNTASPLDITNALIWGCELVKNKEEMSQRKLDDQLSLKWKDDFKQVEEKAKRAEEDLHKFKEYAQSVLTQKDSETECRLAQKDKLIQDLTKTLNENHNMSLVVTETEKVEKKYIDLLQKVEKDKAFLQSQVTQSQREKDELQNQLNEKREKESRKLVSVHKGQDGEELVETWLRDAFYMARIERHDSEKGKMDRHLIIGGSTRVMIDAKAHEVEIKKADVVKFQDNLRDSTDSNIGVLLALYTYIPNHRSQFIETRIVNNKLEIYMNCVSDNPIERLRIVASIIDVWNEYVKISQSQSENDKCSIDELKDWKSKSERAFQTFSTLIVTLKGHYSKMKDDIEKSMKTFADELETHKQDVINIMRSVDKDLVPDVADVATVSKKKPRKQGH